MANPTSIPDRPPRLAKPTLKKLHLLDERRSWLEDHGVIKTQSQHKRDAKDVRSLRRRHQPRQEGRLLCCEHFFRFSFGFLLAYEAKLSAQRSLPQRQVGGFPLRIPLKRGRATLPTPSRPSVAGSEAEVEWSSDRF
jgi:hypothetical protein